MLSRSQKRSGALIILYIYAGTLDLKTLVDLWPESAARVAATEQSKMELFKMYMELQRAADYVMIEDMQSVVSARLIEIVTPELTNSDQKFGVSMIRQIYEDVPHTAWVRVALTALAVIKYRGGSWSILHVPEAEKLMKEHEPAAWGIATH